MEDMDTSETNNIERVKVYYTKNSCVFVLSHPSELYIQGKVKISCLAGNVEIFGYLFQDKPCEIFAPNYNYSHCLKTVEKQNDLSGIFRKLSNKGMSITDAEDIVSSLQGYDAVIYLEQLNNRKINFLENNFTITDLFSKVDKNVEVFRKASSMLGCSLYINKPRRCFDENHTWQHILKPGLHSKGLICGGKSVGKSTFLRYYVNKMLAGGPVLVIDLDPGQCEFTVAGNISVSLVKEPLLGPNFTHLRTPDRMLNVGIINVLDNLKRYTTAVSDLIDYCKTKDEYQNLPWIVNTMGMCDAVGLKLLTYVIIQLQPTFLIQIDSTSVKKKFDRNIEAHIVKRLYREEYQHDLLFSNVTFNKKLEYQFVGCLHDSSYVGINTCLSPRDERYLSVLAYFGAMLDVHNKSKFLEITPYEVSLQNLCIASNLELEVSSIYRILNGKIVALCSKGYDGTKIYTLEDKPLVCHGYGVVRGIDAEGTAYVTTPVSRQVLGSVDTLVYVDWAPELQVEQELSSGRIPYRSPPLQDAHLIKTPRRRFNPLQLLKMAKC